MYYSSVVMFWMGELVERSYGKERKILKRLTCKSRFNFPNWAVKRCGVCWLTWQSRMSSDFPITKNCNTNNWQRSKPLCPDSLNWNFNEHQGETGPSENNAENRDAYLQKDKPDLSQAEAMEWQHKREMLVSTESQLRRYDGQVTLLGNVSLKSKFTQTWITILPRKCNRGLHSEVISENMQSSSRNYKQIVFL